MQGLKVMTAALATVGVVAAVTVGGSEVGAAANTIPHFTGMAAGTAVAVAGKTVQSGSTAPATLDSLTPGRSSTNHVADTNAYGLASAGAVTTSVTSSQVSGGYALVSNAHTAKVSLLGGAISADAVDTTSTVTLINGRPTSKTVTTFVGLVVGKVKLPATIRNSYSVTIPGVAQVTLNAQATSNLPGSVATKGAGMMVTLLQGRGDAPTRSIVQLNPTSAAIGLVGAGYRILGGYGYATRASAQVGSQVNLVLAGAGQTVMPPTGTGARDVDNDTAGVNVPKVATVRVAGSTANGLASNTRSFAGETVETAGVNLFDGLITADALKGSAHVEVVGTGTPVVTAGTQLVNLTVGGRAIGANVAPNTVIDVAGLGTVVINGQYRSATGAIVRLLDIKLTTGRFGLPVGTEVEVGTAAAYFTP